MQVSVSMILKRDGDIAAAIASVLGLADELVVVGPNKTIKPWTREISIARDYGAVIDTGSDQPARSRALELAAGEWILILDSDEVLGSDPLQILDHLKNTAAEILTIRPIICGYEFLSEPRLFKRSAVICGSNLPVPVPGAKIEDTNYFIKSPGPKR